MELYSQKLTQLIKEFNETSDLVKNYYVIIWLVEMWKKNASIYVSIRSSKKGIVMLNTMKPYSGRKKKVPLLLTEVNAEGHEYNRIIFDEEWLMFFTEEQFCQQRKGTTLMQIPIDFIIDEYLENEEQYIGIVINPFHEAYVFYLTSPIIKYLLEFKMKVDKFS